MRAQSFKRGQMQVDRPHADRAAARQRDAHPARASEQRSENEHRGPHRFDQIVGRVRGTDLSSLHRGLCAGGRQKDADVPQELFHRADVPHVGQVREANRLGRQESRRQARQRGVLRPRGEDLALESNRSFDQEAVHLIPVQGFRFKVQSSGLRGSNLKP